MNAVVLLVFILTAQTGPADWPQWRGPERTGHVAPELSPPESWPPRLETDWRVEIGIGHASPVVVDGTIYAFAREGEQEVVRALAARTGDAAWRTGYEAPYRMNHAARGHGKGPKSTPLVAGGRVHTIGINGMVSSVSAETGTLLWQSRFEDRFQTTAPIYGHATSPLLADGKLIVQVGGPGEGAVMALDPATGDVLWSSSDGDGPGYTSPMLIDSVLVTQTEKFIAGFSIETGATLWRTTFRTPYDQNIFTTLPLNDGRGTFVVSGLDLSTRALAPTPRPGDAAPTNVWESPVAFYMSTPVLVNDRLIGFSSERRGHVVALDANTGATLWQSDGRMGENAAVIAWGGWVLVLLDGATLHVLDAEADAFAPVASYEVATSPTWAHPVPTEGGILIKDETGLSLWRLSEANAP